MLLQHYTVSLVHPYVPDGWEEEMTFGVGEKPKGGTRRKKGRRGERKKGPKEETEEEEAMSGSGSGSGEDGVGDDMKVESESGEEDDELDEEGGETDV